VSVFAATPIKRESEEAEDRWLRTFFSLHRVAASAKRIQQIITSLSSFDHASAQWPRFNREVHTGVVGNSQNKGQNKGR